MRQLHRLRHRILAAAPSLLLALGWWAMGLLWPRGSAWDAPVRTRSAASLRFVGLQEGLGPSALASEVALLPSRDLALSREADDPALTLSPLVGEWASRTAAPSGGCFQAVDKGASPRVTVGPPDYRPSFEDTPTAPPAPPPFPPIHLAYDPTLQAWGLHLPSPAPSLPEGFPSRGQAVLHVFCGPEGRVDHAFLEGSTGDRDWDQALVRWIEQGISTNAGGACSGRLVIQLRKPSRL